jgi:hypothetical protein
MLNGYVILIGMLLGRDSMQNINTDGKIILKRVLDKGDLKGWIEVNYIRRESISEVL